MAHAGVVDAAVVSYQECVAMPVAQSHDFVIFTDKHAGIGMEGNIPEHLSFVTTPLSRLRSFTHL